MMLDPRTLGAAFVLLSAILGALLLFAWTHNRKVRSLAWWAATFGFIAIGIGMGHLGQGAPSYSVLLTANALVAFAYGVLYMGCRTFNHRPSHFPAMVMGAVVWLAVFPVIHEMPRIRVLLLSLIAGGYAALSAWELWRHAPQRLVSQRVAVIVLGGLALLNLVRGMLGLWPNSIFWINAFSSRWSAEMAMVLLVYAPTLAFIFLSMAKERIESDHGRTEQALRESEEHYRYSVELNPQIPWTADPQGHILDISPQFYDRTGVPMWSIFDAAGTKALHPEEIAPVRQQWARSLTTGEPFDQELRLRIADGSWRWLRLRAAPRRDVNGTVIRWYGTAEDIQDRKLAEEQLHWAAHHDDLTGLANRRLFMDRLKQELDHAVGTRRSVGLLVMDLDHLKTVNDRFGHDAGDALLQEFAARLCDVVRTTDTVARLGGDEFAIILADVPGEEYVATTASTILSRMQVPLRYGGTAFDCRTSIGGAVTTGPEMTVEELQKQADLALYHCKTTRRGTFKMFRSDMREEAQRTASALEVARTAITSDWIVPFYQPKVDLTSGKLNGFEALLRLRHPRTGIHSPKMIAPAFEDPELGRAIGARMLSSVLKDMRSWLDAGLEIGRVAVNASTAEFRHDDYAERVLAELARADLPASCLEVEVTESVFLGRSVENVEQALRTLSIAGVTIALDDFGTGFASLTHLKQFPVDVIKLDRSFTRDMETNASDAAIVKAVLDLGQSLDMTVVAEGIETAAQVSLLREHSCDLGQGYYFGRPMPAKDVPQFMMSWSLSEPPETDASQGLLT